MVRNITSVLIFSISVCISAPIFAETPPPQYIQFEPGTTKGAIYYPDPENYPNPEIAALNIHPISNRLAHISMEEMSKRGFVVLGMSSRCENNEASCTQWENIALDIKQGIEYLRKLPGITTVILLGGSSGGPLMSFYQAVAEKGVNFCQNPNKLIKCDDRLKDLPPADGIVFRDSHLGDGINSLRSMNPAVINDEEIIASNAAPRIDPRIDPFNPENGYDPNGASTFTDEFKTSYFEAQSARMNRLIEIAQSTLEQIESGSHDYPDDAPFVIPRGDNSRLLRLDLSIHHSTEKPRKFLKNDGSIEDCCIVKSVRPADLKAEMNESFREGTRFLTVRSFLGIRAIRSSSSMDGIDYCSSNVSTVCNVQNISVPILVSAMGGHYFVRNNEIIYEMAASQDKDYIVIEGATHGTTPCIQCMPDGQPYDGRYDHSVRNFYDYVADWIYDRF